MNCNFEVCYHFCNSCGRDWCHFVKAGSLLDSWRMNCPDCTPKTAPIAVPIAQDEVTREVLQLEPEPTEKQELEPSDDIAATVEDDSEDENIVLRFTRQHDAMMRADGYDDY